VTLKTDMATATAALRKIAEQINASRTEYRPITTNSNAAAGTAYKEVTGNPPPVSHLLPGSELNLLNPERPRELAK
jgi:hypothetical protein